MTVSSPELHDAVVIGSGFGGTLAAYGLMQAGFRVLVLERGRWVTRGLHTWKPEASLELTPFFSYESPYRVLSGGTGGAIGSYSCVGGPSVFYGGVSLRLREGDFEPDSRIVSDSGAEWPYRYADLEPYYCRAERLLGVAGDPSADPTEPWRSAGLPQRPAPLAAVSKRLAAAARVLGLHPFRLPLAINYQAGRRAGCAACNTCDTFACAIGAKNDLATTLLPELLARGLRLHAETVVTQLVTRRGRVIAVEAIDKRRNRRIVHRGRVFVCAAGALGTPHLLLGSGLRAFNPAASAVGRYLTRHHNAIVFGLFPHPPDEERTFHKQLGFNDFYFGDGESAVDGKLGGIQQLSTPHAALVRAHLSPALRTLSAPFLESVLPRLTGLLVMAEDQPRFENGVDLDLARTDRYGLPQLRVFHRYSERDSRACGALVERARRILREAGALSTYVHPIRTFSHAAGTVRAGPDPRHAPLDGGGRFRGIDNLYVADGSFMTTVGGVNPSLTIAANALRIAQHLAEENG